MKQRRLITTLLSILLAYAAANSPKDTVSSYLQLLKRGEFEQAGQYTDFSNDLGFWYGSSPKSRRLTGATEALALLSSKLRYEILGGQMRADEATVRLKVDAVNVSRVMEDATEATTARISKNPLNLFRASSLALESVESRAKMQALPMTTSEPVVKLSKRHNSWIVTDDNEVFREAVIGTNGF